MKIAVVSKDDKTVSQHFGQAPLYVVVTVEDGKIVARETREKAGHHTFAPHRPKAPGEKHGCGRGAPARHARMMETIADCQVLIAGGMGEGAYNNLKSRNIEPIVTDIKTIDEAVKLYLEGKLPNLTERLH